MKDFGSLSVLFKAYIDYSPSTFKYRMDDSSTTNNTAPNNNIENTAPKETGTTKDAHNIKTLKEIIDLRSGNNSNESMNNGSNNSDSVPSGNNSDNDSSTGAQS